MDGDERRFSSSYSGENGRTSFGHLREITYNIVIETYFGPHRAYGKYNIITILSVMLRLFVSIGDIKGI